VRKVFAAALAFAVSFGASGSALAAPTPFEVEKAKVVASEALGLYDKGDFQGALTKLQEAQRIADAPTIGLFAARCLDKLGRLVDARAAYVKVAEFELPPTAAPQWAKAKDDAALELVALDERIPTVEIVLVGLGERTATAKIDGTAIDAIAGAHPVDAGAHIVEIVVGLDTFPTTVELAEREKKTVRVNVGGATVPEDSSAPLPMLDILGWTGVGVGGALLIVWGATGGAAMAQASDLGCDGDACPGDVGGLSSLRTASAATFWIGLPIGLAGGALLLVPRLLGDGDAAPEKAAWSPLVGPGFVGVQGRF
jgi:hypothetical protein